ncbi:hypothetical protein ABBQ32_006353 [Trebouxia sp. C0010 RCD-2024]
MIGAERLVERQGQKQVKFPERLDMRPYLSKAAAVPHGCMYQLGSVVVHLGEPWRKATLWRKSKSTLPQANGHGASSTMRVSQR